MRQSTRLATLCLLVAVAAPVRAQSFASTARTLDGSAADASTSASPAPMGDSVVNTPASTPVNVPVNTAANAAVFAAPIALPAAPATTSRAPLAGFQAAAHAPVTATSFAPMAAPARANLGQSRALMIVGAVALVTGAVIGGDPGTLIMVGGAIIGLYGLYEYLQ
jgi:hypothetical protein